MSRYERLGADVSERVTMASWTSAVTAIVLLPDRIAKLLAAIRPIRNDDGVALDAKLQLIHRVFVAGMTLDENGDPDPAELSRALQDMEMTRAMATLVGKPLWGPQARVESATEIVVDGATGPLEATHYAPRSSENSDRKPVILLFHGGGFIVGDRFGIDRAARMLCSRADAHVVSVDYRLAPEHPYPAQLEDGLAAWRWLVARAEGLGGDPTRLAVAGESAGATLATLVAWQTHAAGERAPDAQALFYPCTDMTMSDTYASRKSNANVFPFFAYQFEWGLPVLLVGEEKPPATLTEMGMDPKVSPIRIPDLSGVAPAVVATGGFDMFRDEGEAYGRRLRDAGVSTVVRRYEELPHGFTGLMGASTAAVDAVTEVALILQSRLNTRLLEASV